MATRDDWKCKFKQTKDPLAWLQELLPRGKTANSLGRKGIFGTTN